MVSTPDILANFEQLERLLVEHPVQSPRLTVLPECFACFGDGDKRLLAIAKQDSKQIFNRISSLAKQYGTWIVAGTVPVLSEGGDKFRACCWIVDEHGSYRRGMTKYIYLMSPWRIILALIVNRVSPKRATKSSNLILLSVS